MNGTYEFVVPLLKILMFNRCGLKPRRIRQFFPATMHELCTLQFLLVRVLVLLILVNVPASTLYVILDPFHELGGRGRLCLPFFLLPSFLFRKCRRRFVTVFSGEMLVPLYSTTVSVLCRPSIYCRRIALLEFLTERCIHAGWQAPCWYDYPFEHI